MTEKFSFVAKDSKTLSPVTDANIYHSTKVTCIIHIIPPSFPYVKIRYAVCERRAMSKVTNVWRYSFSGK